MAIIITYDIPDRHVEFKNQMLQNNYKDRIRGTDCETIYFPNTTLYHVTKTPIEARDEAKGICRRLNIRLIRCVITPWGPNPTGVCGEPF